MLCIKKFEAKTILCPASFIIKEITMMSLNHRLKVVSQYLLPNSLADIGSDTLIYLFMHYNIIYVMMLLLVIKGPYTAAKTNVAQHQLTQHIDVRLGDGLSILTEKDKVDNITICGMGGPLIAKILDEGQNKLAHHPRLILQSNIQTETLRKTLQHLNYDIIAEEILEEKGHIYEIVVSEWKENLNLLNKKSLKFGPILLNHKTIFL